MTGLRELPENFMTVKDCTIDGSVAVGIRIDPVKGLDELVLNGGPWFHFPPPPGFKPLCKFDPRAPLKPLGAKLLGLGMAKTMAGR